MNIADEIAKLQQLHDSGALSGEEFAKAKAAVLEKPPSKSFRIGSKPLAWCEVGFSVFVGVVLLSAAFFWLPAGPWRWIFGIAGGIFVVVAVGETIAKVTRLHSWIFCIALLHLVAFITNPDQASLEKTCRENMEKNRAKTGTLEKLAGDALVDVSFERKNYYVFSIGTVRRWSPFFAA